MTDRELLIRIDDLLNKKARWSGNPNFNDKKAYVTFLIKDYVDIVTDLSNQLKQSICERCGKVNPAEIHACTPQHGSCSECGQKKQSEGYALYCVECTKPMREWVGLTDAEVEEVFFDMGQFAKIDLKTFARAIEAKLKEKNNG